MRLKALRPLTAVSSFTAPPSPPPSRAALQPSVVAPRFVSQNVRPPFNDDDDITPPPPAQRPPRSRGTNAALPPPPRSHKRHRPTPKPNLVNSTSNMLKILGGITALVGAYHAAPAVHKKLHGLKDGKHVRREEIIIELPETGAVHPEMGRTRPEA